MYKKCLKRFFDFIISLFALVILSPVMLILAILIKIKLGSPVIFKQERPGKNEKIFTLYKFRSMSNKKDENGNLLPDNERLTKFGKILRSTSLDELPEFVNIIKGDMSLIGPRPLAVCYLPYYNDTEKHRHDVRPGLTGLAQINGRNILSWEEKFKYDIEYIENISFINDVKIFFLTIIKVFKREGVQVRGKGQSIDFDKYRKYTLKKVDSKNLDEIKKKFFKEIKFSMAHTALDGFKGDVYVDDIQNPTFSIIYAGRYSFIDGNCHSEFARFALLKLDLYYNSIIASAEWYKLIEEVFENRFEINYRYSLKKDTKFDLDKLNIFSKNIPVGFEVKKIDSDVLNTISKTDSYVCNLGMTDNYEENGLGYVAYKDEKIVGVCTSNFVYKNSIEINLKVDEECRRKGLATCLAANLILDAIKNKIYPSWDAANLNSLELAKKLGYEFDSKYEVYRIKEK